MDREEILRSARNLYENPGTNEALKVVLEETYPELKESEDERIRKSLIKSFTNQHSANFPTVDGFTREQIIAYLEKQKDYELTEEDRKIIPEALVMLCNDIINHRVHTPISTDEEGARKIKAFLKTFNRRPHKTREEWEGQKPIPANPVGTKEQKPADWSEEDEQYLLVCKNALNKYQRSDHWDANIISKWLEERLKSLRPRPKKELSIEKAIQWLDDTFCFLDNSSGRGRDYEITTHDFDSLEEMYDSFRKAVTVDSQPHWKPSEEQMDDLNFIITALRKDYCDGMADFLASLYNDLQKLL